jgi:hypothetical protein
MSCARPQSVCGGLIARKSCRFLICAFGATCFLPSLSASAGSGTPLLSLSSDSAVASAGFYRLEWHWQDTPPGAGGDFELQESTRADFGDATPLYRGPDLATVISGRGDGTRYYRVRATRDNNRHTLWSNAVEVATAHHPLSRAVAFFAAGALVFVLTLTLIVHGNRQE